MLREERRRKGNICDVTNWTYIIFGSEDNAMKQAHKKKKEEANALR